MAENDEYFSTPEAASRLDLIRHLIENSELVPLVRGPSGIGKSLLAARLQSLAPDNWMVCHFSADSMMQPERLLSHIARCSGLTDAAGDNLTRLVERFELLRKRGTVPVLLVDDVQTLPPTSLITLLRLYERQVGGAPLVSLVLFANEQIDMLLSTPQLQIMSPQAIQVIDLPPLTREEANSFMAFLLANEGLGERFMLDDSKLGRLYRETRGAPGPLAKAILDAVGEERQPDAGTERRFKTPMLFGGVAVGAVVLLLLIFQGPINRLFEAGDRVADLAQPDLVDSGRSDRIARTAEPSGSRPSDLSEKPAAPEMETEQHRSLPQAMAPAEIAQTAAATQEIISAPQVVQSQQAAASPVPSGDSAATTESVVDGGVAAQASDEASNMPDNPVTLAPPEKVPPAPISEPETLQSVVEAPAEPPPAEVVRETTQQLGVETPAAPQISRATPPPKSPAIPLTKSREWLMAQPPDSYTVQLLAVENISSIQAYIDHHSLGDGAFTYVTSRNGKPWYPLLWGSFPDRSTAVAAVQKLPADIRKGGPWIRSFASLQK